MDKHASPACGTPDLMHAVCQSLSCPRPHFWPRPMQVADFKALALRAETNSQLRQALQTLLKLPKDKVCLQ